MGGSTRGPRAETTWHVYVVRCADGSLYTGIAVDVERRIAEHESGRGAKYLRGRAPLELLASSPVGSHGDALRAELAIKRLPATRKLAGVAAAVVGKTQ